MAEPEVNEKALSSSNPLGEDVVVEVAMPKSFKIKMVEASKLSDFKLWGVIASVFANFSVGFFVAAITNTIDAKQSLLNWITGIFCVFTVCAIFMTLRKNYQMNSQETIINMKASR